VPAEILVNNRRIIGAAPIYPYYIPPSGMADAAGTPKFPFSEGVAGAA